MDNLRVMIPDMCQTHQRLLVLQANYGPTDAWNTLIIISNIVLFQGTTCDDRVIEECGGDLEKIQTLGCLACRMPGLFGEVVEVAKTHNFKALKELGDGWISQAKTRVGLQ